MVTSIAGPTDLADRLDALESRERVRRLCHDYSHGFDKRDLETFLSLWHDDAVWVFGPGQEASGLDGIKAAAERMWEVVAESHHWNSNVVVDIDGDSGTGIADIYAIVRGADGSWAQVSATYTDVYARRDGVWAIARRDTEIHFQRPLPGD